MQPLVTHQQEMYETAYAEASRAVSIPDLKITNGTPTEGQRILTLGGGIANDLWHLANKNFIVNADYAVAGLRVGLQNGVNGVLVNLNSCALLPFPDRTFDIIVCNDILEHLLEPLSVLREAVRVLRNDGRIIVNVPNHYDWPMRLRLVLDKGIIWRGLITDHGAYNNEWDYMHIRFFTFRGFKQFLEIAGLAPEKFYWDFGNLAHYYNPDRWIQPQLIKRAAGRPLSRRAKLGIYFIRPFWRVFNTVIPRRVRSRIVSLWPGLLSACFYVRCRKK